MLKVDLHAHVGGDPKDGIFIKYSPKQFIDFMAKKGYDVVAITPHLENNYDKKLIDYAKGKGVLLIMGVELDLEGKDVLVLNVPQDKLKDITKIKDLEKIKAKDNLIIAPHPFYQLHSLGNKLVKNIDIFDAIEVCHFYTNKVNKKRNDKAITIAKKYNKALVANSDIHMLEYFNEEHYSLVNSQKDIISIFNAIKGGKVEIRTKPLSFWVFTLKLVSLLKNSILHPQLLIRSFRH